MKNVHKINNVCYQDLVISVCLALVSMHTCLKCEGHMINHLGRRGNNKKEEKWLRFEKYRSYWLNISRTYTMGISAHVYTAHWRQWTIHDYKGIIGIHVGIWWECFTRRGISWGVNKKEKKYGVVRISQLKSSFKRWNNFLKLYLFYHTGIGVETITFSFITLCYGLQAWGVGKWHSVLNWYCVVCCLSRYYCIVDNRVIIAFVNSSLYSWETNRQVKEMVTLCLFIESPLQIHCIKYQRKAHPYSSLVHS